MGKSKRKNQKLRRSKKQKKRESKKRRIKRKKAIITKRRKRAPDYYSKWDDIVIPEDVLVMPGDRPAKPRGTAKRKKGRKRAPDYYTKWDSVFIPEDDIVMPAEDDSFLEDDIVMPPPPERDIDDDDSEEEVSSRTRGELMSTAPSIADIGFEMEERAGSLDRAEEWLQKHFRNFYPEEMDDRSFYYYDRVLGDWYERYRENPGPWRREMNKLVFQMGKYFKRDGSLRNVYADQEIDEEWEI